MKKKELIKVLKRGHLIHTVQYGYQIVSAIVFDTVHSVGKGFGNSPRTLISTEYKSVELTTEIITNQCQFDTEDINPYFSTYFRYVEQQDKIISIMLVNDKWYPTIIQRAELSHQTDQVVSLPYIKYVHELQDIWNIMSKKQMVKI